MRAELPMRMTGPVTRPRGGSEGVGALRGRRCFRSVFQLGAHSCEVRRVAPRNADFTFDSRTVKRFTVRARFDAGSSSVREQKRAAAGERISCGTSYRARPSGAHVRQVGAACTASLFYPDGPNAPQRTYGDASNVRIPKLRG